jgi:hypothetical protein
MEEIVHHIELSMNVKSTSVFTAKAIKLLIRAALKKELQDILSLNISAWPTVSPGESLPPQNEMNSIVRMYYERN